MAKPASSDLRKRVILAVLAGQSSRAVARRFNVAPSSPSKWTQHYRETGSFEPRKMGGHRRPLLEPHESFIMTRVTEMSHVTVRGLHDELVQRGIKVAPDTIWRFLRDRGLSHKKKAFMQSSKIVVMSCAGGNDGKVFSNTLRLNALSLLMKPGSKPIWRRYAGGLRKANASMALRPMGAGGH